MSRHGLNRHGAIGTSLTRDYLPLSPYTQRSLRALAAHRTEFRVNPNCSLCEVEITQGYKLRHRMIVCPDCYDATNRTNGA